MMKIAFFAKGRYAIIQKEKDEGGTRHAKLDAAAA